MKQGSVSSEIFLGIGGVKMYVGQKILLFQDFDFVSDLVFVFYRALNGDLSLWLFVPRSYFKENANSAKK